MSQEQIDMAMVLLERLTRAAERIAKALEESNDHGITIADIDQHAIDSMLIVTGDR